MSDFIKGLWPRSLSTWLALILGALSVLALIQHGFNFGFGPTWTAANFLLLLGPTLVVMWLDVWSRSTEGRTALSIAGRQLAIAASIVTAALLVVAVVSVMGVQPYSEFDDVSPNDLRTGAVQALCLVVLPMLVYSSYVIMIGADGQLAARQILGVIAGAAAFLLLDAGLGLVGL